MAFVCCYIERYPIVTYKLKAKKGKRQFDVDNWKIPDSLNQNFKLELAK